TGRHSGPWPQAGLGPLPLPFEGERVYGPRQMRMLRILGLVGLCTTLWGCAHSPFGSSSSGDVTVNYASDAKQNYELGMKELDNKNYLEAAKYLEYVSAKFPYSTYSAQAELALADADFDQEKFVEAIERYKNFIKLHPTHAKVDYASYRIGLSHENQIP